MRFSKKQQTIIEILQQQGGLKKSALFETLEGPIEDKKTYRSRYNSFTQTVKKLAEKGAVEWQEETLVLASEQTQTKVKNTRAVLATLKHLREEQQPLTLANLNQWTNIRDWVGSVAEWKLGLPPVEEHRTIGLDAILDDSPEMIEPLLYRLNVEIEKVLSSGLLFGSLQCQQLQREIHSHLCEKLRKFSIPHKTLKATIEKNLPHQSSQKTICELLEPLVFLEPEETQQIVNKFEYPHLKQTAGRLLLRMFATPVRFKPQLKQRFPGFFTGNWEWDRLYQQLVQKIADHAKLHGFYQTPEEWQSFLKQKARHRFQQAQSRFDSKTVPPSQSPVPPSLDTCYELLGLEATENLEEIRIAFRKLVKVHHPDLGGNSEFFRSLNEAYTHLITSLEKR